MSFISIEFLYLLILPFIYSLFYKLKKEDLLYSVVFVLIVIALSRPVIIEESIENESKVEFIVALDISKSMLAKDVLPNRFEFAKQKVLTLLDIVKSQKISLMAYSNQPYLIAPFSDNYETLKFFIQNLHLKDINQNGSDIMKLLKASEKFYSSKTNRAILIISDGTEQESFQKEIEFAKQKNISVFVYVIASSNGTVIEYEDTLVKDKNNQVVVTKRNENIKFFALETNGEYQEYSLTPNDLEQIVNTITKQYKFNLLKENSQNKVELFYYLVAMVFILFLFARFDIKGKRK